MQSISGFRDHRRSPSLATPAKLYVLCQKFNQTVFYMGFDSDEGKSKTSENT